MLKYTSRADAFKVENFVAALTSFVSMSLLQLCGGERKRVKKKKQVKCPIEKTSMAQRKNIVTTTTTSMKIENYAKVSKN